MSGFLWRVPPGCLIHRNNVARVSAFPDRGSPSPFHGLNVAWRVGPEPLDDRDVAQHGGGRQPALLGADPWNASSCGWAAARSNLQIWYPALRHSPQSISNVFQLFRGVLLGRNDLPGGHPSGDQRRCHGGSSRMDSPENEAGQFKGVTDDEQRQSSKDGESAADRVEKSEDQVA